MQPILGHLQQCLITPRQNALSDVTTATAGHVPTAYSAMCIVLPGCSVRDACARCWRALQRAPSSRLLTALAQPRRSIPEKDSS